MNLAAQQCLDNAGAIRACARDDTTTTPSTASATVSGHRGMGRGGLEPVAPRNPGSLPPGTRRAPGLATRIGAGRCQTCRLTANLAGSVLASATVRWAQSRAPVASAGTACICLRTVLLLTVCLAHLRRPTDRIQSMPSVSRVARMDRTVDCQLRGGSDQHPSHRLWLPVRLVLVPAATDGCRGVVLTRGPGRSAGIRLVARAASSLVPAASSGCRAVMRTRGPGRRRGLTLLPCVVLRT